MARHQALTLQQLGERAYGILWTTIITSSLLGALICAALARRLLPARR